jgi:hypothetical protein
MPREWDTNTNKARKKRKIRQKRKPTSRHTKRRSSAYPYPTRSPILGKACGRPPQQAAHYSKPRERYRLIALLSVIQWSGRYWKKSGHCVAIINRSLLTKSDILRLSIDALRKVYWIILSACATRPAHDGLRVDDELAATRPDAPAPFGNGFRRRGGSCSEDEPTYQDRYRLPALCRA